MNRKGTDERPPRPRPRGQMNLPALAVALLILTMVTGLSVGIADRALVGADRTPTKRRIAVATSERFVSADGPLTIRANVLDGTKVANLNATRLMTLFPVLGDHDVQIRLGDTILAERGSPSDGTTIRRIVLVENRSVATRTPPLSGGDPQFTLPRRTPNATLVVHPPDGTAVSTVRANGRVVLRNESGLDGEFHVSLSRFETTRFTFDTNGALPTGSVRVTYYPGETRKSILAVTVDG